MFKVANFTVCSMGLQTSCPLHLTASATLKELQGDVCDGLTGQGQWEARLALALPLEDFSGT